MAVTTSIPNAEFGTTQDAASVSDTVDYQRHATSAASIKRDAKKKIRLGSLVAVAAIAAALPFFVLNHNQKAQSRGEESPNHFFKFRRLNEPSFPSTDNRFDASLPSFSRRIMEQYESCDELGLDIETALMVMVNHALDDYSNYDCSRGLYAPPRGDGDDLTGTVSDESSDDMNGTRPVYSNFNDKFGIPLNGEAGESKPSNDYESSYKTNNQVDGVDEADVVKSDGTFVFVAYGAELVMMDLNGSVLSRLVLPGLPRDDAEFEEQKEEMEYGEDMFEVDHGSAEAFSLPTRYPPDEKNELQRDILALLLDVNSQTVIALSHYKSHNRGWRSSAFMFRYQTKSLILSGSIEGIPGRYQNARSVGSIAHVVSTLPINSRDITAKLSPCGMAWEDMTVEEYQEAAFELAKESIHPYAQKILEGLRLTNSASSECANIVRVNSMIKAEDEANETEEMNSQVLDLTSGDGVLNAFTQVTSFDMSKESFGPNNVGTAGAFIPTGETEMYANRDFVVLAGRGWQRSSVKDHHSYEEYTFLMGFEILKGVPQVVKRAVGEVKGYLLNQFSIDYYNGFLRVATTTNHRWDPVMDEYTGEEEWMRVAEPSSQVTKLQFIKGHIQTVGELGGLGKAEEIFACRFLRDRAYLVTFRNTNPLYVIDMVPDVPKLLGKLTISGYSSYMHPAGENDEYLLAVGQEADEDTGRELGLLKISLFDVSVPTNPNELQKHVLSTDGKGLSSSYAQWDHHAFRYLDQSQKLILPAYVFRRGAPYNFDGFVVFDIQFEGVDGIQSVGLVTHADEDLINFAEERYCFGTASLSSRSMVFSGNLLTFKGHSVKMSAGLGTLEDMWERNLDKDRDPENEQCYEYSL